VQNFRYFGRTLTGQNSIHEEIKGRLKSGNAWCHSVQNLLSSGLLSKNIKIKIHGSVILPITLHGCETWSLTCTEKHRLRVFNNRILRKIFGPKNDKATGMEKTNKEELDNVYSPPNIIQVIKSRRMIWVGQVVHMEDKGVPHRVLVGRPKGKRPLGRPRHRWENNIKMDLKEVGCGGMG
jgi:hypothetical protein